MALIDLVAEDSRILIDAEDLVRFGDWNATVSHRADGRPNLLVNDWRVSPVVKSNLGRFILDLAGTELEVDHRNGDTLDCRRDNLRPATRCQNMQNRGVQKNNTSGYKGVSYDSKSKLYLARIYYNRQSKRLGGYMKAEEAARAYDKAAKELHGEFAKLNFPEVS